MPTDDWSDPRGVKVARVEAAEVRRGERPQRKRKDTKAWCKGKVGREHQPVTVVPTGGMLAFATRDPCRLDDRDWLFRTGYRCHHQVECAACGKVLKPMFDMTAADCPDHVSTEENDHG